MDPLRLRFLLLVALATAGISPALAASVSAQATKQLHTRWPLAGCGVKYDGQTTYVVAVGRS